MIKAKIEQINAQQCKKGHLYQMFGWGNMKSLKDDPARCTTAQPA